MGSTPTSSAMNQFTYASAEWYNREMGNHNHKDNFLGMPHGTANQRLRKLLLFDLIHRLGETSCFRCGNEISSVDELSIDHKSPWEGVDPALFWDLNNIAFSHLSCNLRCTRNFQAANSFKPLGPNPQGMSWCSTHQVYEPVDHFWKHRHSGTGLDTRCKAAKRAAKTKPRICSHGTQAGYRAGCRCVKCISIYIAARREHYQKTGN